MSTLRSMTGFGRAEGVVNGRKLTVELRSLNSRQFDLLLRLPGIYREKEAEVRNWATERIGRGKAELSIGIETAPAGKRTSFDQELVAEYYAELKAIAERIDPHAKTDLLGYVLRLPDVVATAKDELGEEEWRGVEALMEACWVSFDAFRTREGATLHAELDMRSKKISQLLDEVMTHDRGRAERMRERLLARLAELRGQIDPARLEQEMIFYLEKLDITEEQVRLRAHLSYFGETMSASGEQGRKLNFISQEMGREINTLGAKANDADVQRLVVQMKDELEKIKEQLMNIL